MAFALWKGLSKVTQTISQTAIFNYQLESSRSIFLQSCLYRARRSTRERKLKLLRKRKAQKAAEQLKKGPVIPYFKRKIKDSSKSSKGLERIDDSNLEVCEDNVWFKNMFKLRNYSFAEAVIALRESHHPTLYNEPNSPINAYIDIDMSTDKKTKFYENFEDVVSVKYPYKHNEDRSILVFCKLREQMDAALEAGATLAGGTDVITAVKRGKIVLPDFQFIIAHPNIMHDLTVIRGLLRKKFPDLESGTLGQNLVEMVKNLRIGIRYESKRDDFDPKNGWVDAQLGFLDMEIKELEENLRALLAAVRTKGPKRTKNLEDYKFLRRCFITTPLHQEKLLIPIDDYVEPEEIIDSDDEDEVKEVKRA